jgi:hypothetical protein
MSVTEVMSHPEMSWLKKMASLNMAAMLVTAPTFQEEIFWLKLVAPLNMPEVSVTLEGRVPGTVVSSASP